MQTQTNQRIWFREYQLHEIQQQPDANNVGSLLGIEFIEIGPDYLVGKMPVDDRHRQPAGLLHGGVSVVLAETLGSIASYLCIDTSQYTCVGLEVNANHLAPVKGGHVRAVCSPIRVGRTTHVWDIRISNDAGKLSCVSRLTVSIIPLSSMLPK